MSVLDDLWFGNIAPDMYLVCKTDEYKTRLREQHERTEKFWETLSKEQRKAVIELEREESLLRISEEQNLFVRSFKLGARMMLEVLSEA